MCYALLGKVELILITTCSIRIEVSGEDPQENADSDQHGVYDSVGKTGVSWHWHATFFIQPTSAKPFAPTASDLRKRARMKCPSCILHRHGDQGTVRSCLKIAR